MKTVLLSFVALLTMPVFGAQFETLTGETAVRKYLEIEPSRHTNKFSRHLDSPIVIFYNDLKTQITCKIQVDGHDILDKGEHVCIIMND